MAEVHDVPSAVAAEGGHVFVDGPGNTAYSMSPDAAAETSDRLLTCAAEAQGQRLEIANRAEERRLRGH